MPSIAPLADAAAIPLSSLAVASLSRSQAELSLRIGLGCHAAVPALDAIFSVHLDSETSPDWPEALRLSAPFGEIELMHGARLLRALSGIDLGAAAPADPAHWEWLQAAVCGRLAGTPFDSVHGLAHGAVAGGPERVTVRLTLRSASHCVVSHARASAPHCLQWLAAGAWRRQQSPASLFAGTPLVIPVPLARHSVPAHALATLKAGDVILPAGAAFDCLGRGTLAWGALQAQVQFQAPATLIILALENRVDTMNWDTATDDAERASAGQADAQADDELAPAGLEMTAPLDEVQLTLAFELGQVQTTLGAMRSLGVGATMLLTQAHPASIAIMCGKRKLGWGEVVDVEGQLGVRIVEWAPA
ncbi:type III secretion protein Q [Oxalobacteraceae bacterium GrIS 1.11]